MKTSGRYDACLSYAREDKDFAVARLRAALMESRLEVWVDLEDILGGAKWRDRIHRGIEGCKAFVFVVTPESVASQHCRKELDDASAQNKLIVPVVHGDVDEHALPPAIADAEWIFLRSDDDFATGIDKLVEALQTDLAWRDEHTRLAGRAREWLDAGRDSSYLLRGADLREAETWLSQREGHREAPTVTQAEYVVQSRQFAGRRQRARSSQPS